jgi:dephospho-CoA kinase
MKKVGITGGIGSGKSTICRVFELLKVPVYYADDTAKKILNTNPVIFKKVVEIFGKEITDIGGEIDRKKLAAIVFTNKKKLEQLNKIVHPAVINDFEEWCRAKSDFPYILKEAAILFESGTYKNVDQIIMVTAPLEMRIKRVMNRDGVSEAEVSDRISRQLSDEEKIKRSDFIIRNDEQQLVIPQILEIHKLLSGS